MDKSPFCDYHNADLLNIGCMKLVSDDGLSLKKGFRFQVSALPYAAELFITMIIEGRAPQ